VANFSITGATGDGSAQFDSGNYHQVTEIDVQLVTPGFYVTYFSTVSPRRTYQVGWVGLSVASAFPGTTTPIYQFSVVQMFVDAEFRIFTEPTTGSTPFAWGADTVMWGVRDSVININVWFG
jgi:hypothetical protein